MISLTIDNKRVTVPDGTTILDAAAKVGSSIPTLCYLKDLNVIGACRICMVEVEGARALVASCVTPAAEGMEVKTTSPRLIEARRDVLELILSDHPMECLTCVRNDNCELQSLAAKLGVRSVRYEHTAPEHAIDASGLGIQRDPNKCIVCGRCVAVCSKVQTVDALSVSEAGHRVAGRSGLRPAAGRRRMRSVRPVRAGLSDRRHLRDRRHRQGLAGARRPEEACGRADRAGRPRPARRGTRA